VRLNNTPQAPNVLPPTSVVFYSCRIGERAYDKQPISEVVLDKAREEP